MKDKPVLGQGAGSMIGRGDLLHEISLETIPIAEVDHFLFLTEVIQDIRGVGECGFDLRVAAFMLGRDIGDMIRQLDQFLPPVVGLFDDRLPRLGDVMLEADNIFEAKLLS